MAMKIIKGTVVSDVLDKSVTVLINFQQQHKTFKKIVRRSKKVMAHDEQNRAKRGDVVTIQESRPYSKRKSFVLLDVVEQTS